MSAIDAGSTVERRIVNPWAWQDRLGFVQAIHLRNSTETLVVSGQGSMTADGEPLHDGDMAAQLAVSLANLETVLSQAGFAVADIDRLDVFTTDVDGLLADWPPIAERLVGAGCRPTVTLLGVDRLARPELLVELEVTAHR